MAFFINRASESISSRGKGVTSVVNMAFAGALALLSMSPAHADSKNNKNPKQAQPNQASCFDGQTGGKPYLGAKAASTLHIVTIDSNGERVLAGTGFIVSNSAGAEGHNRILTAWHVTRAFEDRGRTGLRLVIESPSGQPLGFGRIVGRGTGNGRSETAPLSRGDAAVIALDSFIAEGAEAYDRLPSLELAKEQSALFINGTVASPAGIDIGASGAALIGPDGRVIGLVVVKDRLSGVPIVKVNGGDIVGMNADPDHAYTTRDVDLPAFSDIFAEPISEAPILAALGRAGVDIKVGGSLSSKGLGVIIPAFPRSTCVIFRAFVYPVAQSVENAISEATKGAVAIKTKKASEKF